MRLSPFLSIRGDKVEIISPKEASKEMRIMAQQQERNLHRCGEKKERKWNVGTLYPILFNKLETKKHHPRSLRIKEQLTSNEVINESPINT